MTLKKEDVPNSGPEKNEKVEEQNLFAEMKRLKEELEELKKRELAQEKLPAGITGEQLQKILEVVTINQKDIDYSQGVQEEAIPVEDYVKEGVAFFAPFSGYVISGDIRKGVPVKLPFNKKSIFFEWATSRRIQQGKYDGISHISMYRSHSKKEIEWLREHSFYGSYFYETSKSMANLDAQKASRVAEIMSYLKSMDLNDLYKRADEYGIQKSEDVASLRGNIAMKMWEAEDKQNIEAARTKIAMVDKETLLLNGSRG